MVIQGTKGHHKLGNMLLATQMNMGKASVKLQFTDGLLNFY